MTSLDKIEFFENNSAFYTQLVADIRKIFDSAISEHNYMLLRDIPVLLDDDRLTYTGEINRICNMLRIVSEESAGGVRNDFLSDVCDYKELYDKYLKTVVMLRRIELYPDEMFADEAYEYISSISVEALSRIIEAELYERRLAMVVSIVNRGVYSLENKLKWFLYLLSDYDYEWIYLEIASIYLECGMIDNALDYLMKIKEPTESTNMLIAELREAANRK